MQQPDEVVVEKSKYLALRRHYASAAVAEKQQDEEEDFFASDIIPNAVAPPQKPSSSSKATRIAHESTPDDPGLHDAAQASPNIIDGPASSDRSGSRKPVTESTPFTSLKGKINHNTLKALTFKPFQLTAMSEVQKRVLALMPELAGGKPKASAEAEEQGDGEIERTNALGQKVSTAARGKHDLLVKAKTGTGKTIVSHSR